MTTHGKLHAIARDTTERRGRQVVLVDLENLAGGPGASAEELRAIWQTLTGAAVRIRPGDVTVVAASRFCARQAVSALWGEPVQWRWRDGANAALLDFADADHLAQRYARLVIASGNGAFGPLARGARERGMSVHQITGRGLPSRELQDACHTRATMRLGAPSAAAAASAAAA